MCSIVDRGKRGTKYHVAVTGDGVPVACRATAANVRDTLLFERLFLAAFAVMARIKTVFADRGYDAESSRDLCRRFGAEPRMHKRRQPHGSGLGKQRWPVERSNAWLLENKRLACATTGTAPLFRLCCKQLAYSWLQANWHGSCENRLLAVAFLSLGTLTTVLLGFAIPTDPSAEAASFVQLSGVTVVPEPISFGLLLSGIAAAVSFRRRAL